jgi:hypothetical protein
MSSLEGGKQEYTVNTRREFVISNSGDKTLDNAKDVFQATINHYSAYMDSCKTCLSEHVDRVG